MQKELFKTFVAALTLVGLQTMAANYYTYRLEQEGSTVAKEGYNTAKINVYATYDADVQTTAINLTYEDGFAFNKDASGFAEGVIVGGTPAKGENTKKKTAYFSVTGQQAVASIKAKTGEFLLGSFEFSVDMSLVGTTKTLTLASTAMGVDGKNMVSKDSTTSIPVPIYEAFTFAWNEQGLWTDEDTAFVLNADNLLDYFESKAFNATTGKMEDETDVTFSNVSIADATRGDAALPEAEVTDNGKSITITPAAYQYGQYLLSFSATNAGVTKTVENVRVVISAVNHKPEVVVTDFEATEMLPLTFKFTCTDEGEVYLPTDYKAILDGVEYTGTITGDVEFTFTSSDVISYTTVTHMEAEPFRKVSFDFVVTDEGKEGLEKETTLVSKVVKINDTDQAADTTTATLVLNPTDNITVESIVTATAAGATDADGDAIDYEYAARKSDAVGTLNWSSKAELEVSTLGSKGDTIEVFARAVTEPFGNKKTVDLPIEQKKSFLIGNSKPTVTANKTDVFIQMGKSTTGAVTLTFADPDGVDDFKEYVVSENADLTIDVAGNELTITVKDAEKELTGTTFDVKAIDTEDAESEAVVITVKYQEDPAPVIADFAVVPGELEEDMEFTASITAHDQEKVGDIEPSGVKSIVWTLLKEDVEVAPELYEVIGCVTPTSEGTEEVTSTWTIKLKYEAIEHPAESANYALQVTVADGNGASSTEKLNIQVNDRDQLPGAPTELAPTEAEYTAKSTSITVSAVAGEDADGDAVAVYYKWACGATETAFSAENTITNAAYPDFFQKGNTIVVTAVSRTTPYGAGDVDSEEVSTEITIGNSAPELVEAKKDGEVLDIVEGEVNVTCAEDSEGFVLSIQTADIDAEDGKDTLSWTATLSNADAGTLEKQGVLGTLGEQLVAYKFVPSADYNTVDTQDDLTATFTATDESGATVQLVANITVTEVNDKPVIAAADQFALPEQFGKDITFAIKATTYGDKYEDAAANQTLTGKELDVYEDTDSIIDGTPEFSTDAQGNVCVTFKVSAEAALGKKAVIKVSATDNGKTDGAEDAQTSEAIYVTVYTGATPWYPIIPFNCEQDYDGYTVVINNSGVEQDITINENRKTVMPADYISSMVAAFEPNAELLVTVYPIGSATPCVEEFGFTVSDYDVPGAATSAGEVQKEVDAGGKETGKVTIPEINAPMAQSYKLEVVRCADEMVVYSKEAEFLPAENELMILPVIAEQSIQLTKNGDYAVFVTGINPKGEGARTQIVNLNFSLTDLAAFAWPVDGEGKPDLTAFSPADGTILATGENVTFTWAEVPWATAYTVRVLDAEGRLVSRKTVKNETQVTINLVASPALTVNYSWYVTAINDEDEKIDSATLSLIISQNADYPIPTQVSFDEGAPYTLCIACANMPQEASNIKFDYQLYDVETEMWTSRSGVRAEVNADNTGYELPVVKELKADDFVIIRFKTGDYTSEWVIYQIQSK